eukprot:CAMPEP_0118686524 /NCGR_PEP_ID=MMETSP0800-20121206/7859_1 /TAXON_ID=210618 ORGANISM="Striatella unipunctata, Strain CCMP2910" /NCGR_SAMPLE_ID=MMETSP0800 /ASSEMBLY_ACC=CAM_ASM_000638 /LENGTH=184 /DNA_ID=CAMNT_0006583575 /DNA_START=205 /DNA_END=759 /DNA_ORIENTATION=+
MCLALKERYWCDTIGNKPKKHSGRALPKLFDYICSQPSTSPNSQHFKPNQHITKLIADHQNKDQVSLLQKEMRAAVEEYQQAKAEMMKETDGLSNEEKKREVRQLWAEKNISAYRKKLVESRQSGYKTLAVAILYQEAFNFSKGKTTDFAWRVGMDGLQSILLSKTEGMEVVFRPDARLGKRKK